MKKFTFLSFALTFAVVLSISAKNTKLGAGGDLTAAITTAANGDTITLTSSTVYTVADYQPIGSIVLQGDAKLAKRPIVQELTPNGSNGLFWVNSGANLTLDNLVLDANGNYRVVLCYSDAIGDISITNCDLKNYVNCAIVSKGVNDFSTQGSLYVENCTATGVGSFILSGSAAGTAKSFKDITVLNTYIANSNGSGNVGAAETFAAYEGATGSDATIRPETLAVTHCTFNNCHRATFRMSTVTSTTISDCIFANNDGQGNEILGMGNWDTKCAIFNYSPDYLSNKVVTDMSKVVTTDPVFDSNGIATAIDYVNKGTDAKTIGYYNAGQISTAGSANNIRLGAGADLSAAITAAADGDTITLTSSTVYTIADYQPIGSIVIQGDPTLHTKPIVQELTPNGSNGLFWVNNGANLTLDNLVLDANGNYRVVLCYSDTIGDISITNCELKNYVNCAIVSKGVNDFSTQGSLYVENCTATGVGSFILSGSAAGTAKSFKDITVLNTYVANSNGSGNVGAAETFAAYEGATGSDATIRPENLTITHCTFNNCHRATFRISTVTSTTISDCIFANNDGQGNEILGMGNWDTKCAIFNYSPDYLSNKVVTDMAKVVTTDPMFNSNGIATSSDYVNKGTDGNTIGYYNAGQIQTAVNSLQASNLKVYRSGDNLIVTGAKETSRYAVYSIAGQQLLGGMINSGSININSLNRGIYFIRINSEAVKFIK